MPSYSLSVGQDLAPVRVEKGAIVSIASASDAIVEYTYDTKNPVWQPVPFIGNMAYSNDPEWLRVRSVTTATTVIVNNSPADYASSSLRPDWNWSGYNGNILSSLSYGLVGDNSTDNNSAITAWTADAARLIAAGQTVQMVLQPGIYRTTGRHTIPGAAHIRFINATLRATGTDETAPLLTWGALGGLGAVTGGTAIDINCDAFVSHSWFNRNFIGFKMLNKSYSYARISGISGFTTGLQLAADGFSSYNTVDILSISVCQSFVELNSSINSTPFCSENVFKGGNINGTSSFNNFGSNYAFVFSTEFDTGYHGNSGNVWYKPSLQQNGVGLTWSGATTLVANRRYYAALTGSEWLCKTGGVSGGTEPSIIPSVVAGTRVDVATMSTTIGSAIVTMASTAGISAGWHMRGTNPLSNFPFNTYVQSVDSGVQLTLTNVAAATSAIYRAHFIAPTTDNAATLVYVGPYRRTAIWHRDNGGSNSILDARRETCVGEAIIASGAYMWPRTANSTSLAATVTLEGVSVTTAKDCNYPTWAVNTAYVTGDMVRVAVVGSCFLECIVGGTSHASTEPTMVNKPGTTTVDNTVTWIERTMTDTVTRGDLGNYSGAIIATGAEVRHTQDVPVRNSETLGNMHLRAIGSASGWIVKGYCKRSAGTLSQSFAAGDMLLSREGILLVSSTIGVLVRTDKQRFFRIAKMMGTYKSNRGVLVPFDKAFVKMDCRNGQSDYNPRFTISGMSIGGGLDFADPNDNIIGPNNVMVGPDIPYMFVGINRGSTGTPVALTLNGLQITALPFNCAESDGFRADVFTLHGMFEGPRASLGTPTSGFFMSAGEYIQNATYTSGAGVMGYKVKTAGMLAPTWLTSTVYLKGQMVVGNSGADLNRVYAANGSFTSGTAPTGTTLNQVDGTATAIVSGDVATWDYMGVLAVLDADEDSQALFAAGNAGATPTPNCQSGLRQTWTQSANMTVGAPTNPPSVGSILTLLFTSNGVWTTAWNATYRNAPAWAASANTQKATAAFMYDGTNWQFIGGSTAFA